MPEKLHRELAVQARKKGLTGDRFNAYVYGTLNKVEHKKKKRRAEMAALSREGKK